MNNEVEAFPGELKQLRELVQKFRTIVEHANAEKNGLFFICGEGGQKDEMGLPEMILVCPSFGLDGMCRYVKSGEYSAPGY